MARAMKTLIPAMGHGMSVGYAEATGLTWPIVLRTRVVAPIRKTSMA